MIKLRQTTTPEEVRDEVDCWYDLFINKKIYLWLGVAFLAGGGILFFYRGGESNSPGLVMLVSAIIYMCYMFLIRRRMTVMQLFQSLRNSPEFGQEVEYLISDAGEITRRCNGRTGTHMLSDFKTALETPELLMLFVNRSGWLAFRRSAFADIKDYQKFMDLIQKSGICLIRWENDRSK